MKNEEKFYRVNHLIKFSPVIVIDEKGKNLGALPLARARDLASQVGQDLVEIAPNSRPPVCRIMDFGKFKFEQNLKEKKQKNKQKKQSQTKEIRLSPVIQENDIETKLKAAQKFLAGGQKVNIKLEFRRREVVHQDLGFTMIKKFINRLEEFGVAPSPPKMEGKSLFCLIEPKDFKEK